MRRFLWRIPTIATALQWVALGVLAIGCGGASLGGMTIHEATPRDHGLARYIMIAAFALAALAWCARGALLAARTPMRHALRESLPRVEVPRAPRPAPSDSPAHGIAYRSVSIEAPPPPVRLCDRHTALASQQAPRRFA